MRRVAVFGSVVAAVIAACGGSSTAPQQPADAGSPPQGVEQHSLAVTLAGTGSGRVRSADGALDCPGACTVSAAVGAGVSLQATAAAGSHFTGWSGACSGAAVCGITLSADSATTATFDLDTPPGPPGPGSHVLKVTLNGSGHVVSTPAGLDCGTICAATFTDGTVVMLQPTAASGFTFDGWGGACSGAGPCAVKIGADAQVYAIFLAIVPPPPPPPPPPPATHALTVAVSGNGRVVSTPAGIDCPGTCTAPFAAGTPVSLAATPATGSKFDGYSNACAGAACSLAMTADATVSAAFSTLPPPPPDECAGLLPAALPSPVIPSLSCNGGCTFGTSDDGAGNFALRSHTSSQFGSGALAWTLFQVRDGKVVLTKQLLASDQSLLTLFSQPTGFSMLDAGADGISLYSFSDAGVMTHSTGLSGGQNQIAADPSGGFSDVFRAQKNDNTAANYTFGRYDRGGALLAGGNVSYQGRLDVIYSDTGHSTLYSSGMTLSHHTLAMVNYEAGNPFIAFWVDEAGNMIGHPFNPPRGGTLQFLLDGTLLQRTGATFTDVWADGSPTPSALPSWLQSRANGTWLYPIRQGAGYAMGGTCDGVEVLSKAGNSCGCVAVPGVSALTSIGRDGSLIVPVNDQYQLYPGLFH